MFSSLSVEDLISLGRELCKGHELIIPLQPKEKLQDFVLGYVAGQIYTDRDIPVQTLGMVFMPLLFGGLAPPEDILKVLQTHLQDIGPEPQKPKQIEPPNLPKKPKLPRVLTPIVPNPNKVRKIQSAIEWVEARQEDLDKYFAEIARVNLLREEKNALRLARWQIMTQEWEAACLRLNHAFEEATRNAEAAWLSWKTEYSLWELKKSRNEAIRKGFYTQYTANLGCIWEHASQAGPRSVNGFPIFFSMSLMHKDDFARAIAAIERERLRQKEIEI